MRTFVVAGWMAREGLRSGWVWSIGLAAAVLGPVCWLASPLGIASEHRAIGQYVDSIWFLSTYLGALAGLVLLARAGTLWAELGPKAQAGVAVSFEAGFALVVGLVALASVAGLGVEFSIAVAPALLCAGHWAALACFVHRSASTLPGQAILLTLLGWWVPAVVEGSDAGERVRWVLGPQRHLEVGGGEVETLRGVLVDTIPLLAWWVAAALLPTRRAVRR